MAVSDNSQTDRFDPVPVELVVHLFYNLWNIHMESGCLLHLGLLVVALVQVHHNNQGQAGMPISISHCK
jgi:hypothetical protein